MTSDGLHPSSDGLQPTGDGLHPSSDGLPLIPATCFHMLPQAFGHRVHRALAGLARGADLEAAAMPAGDGGCAGGGRGGETVESLLSSQ